jgi:hypothetical protein
VVPLTGAISGVFSGEVDLRANDVADALEDKGQGHGDDFLGVACGVQVCPTENVSA